MSQKGRKNAQWLPAASSYSHPEGQSRAPLCVTEHDNCLWMAMLSTEHMHLCLMHCSFQLLLLLLSIAFKDQGLSLVSGRLTEVGVIKGPAAPIYQCLHHDRPIIHRTLGPPTGSPCQPGEHRTWRLARKDILRLVRCVGAVPGPCDHSSQMEKVRALSPAFCPCYKQALAIYHLRTSRLELLSPFLLSLRPSPSCLAELMEPHMPKHSLFRS
jgi:hypothetical protein